MSIEHILPEWLLRRYVLVCDFRSGVISGSHSGSPACRNPSSNRERSSARR
jgi:hypothetical protein